MPQVLPLDTPAAPKRRKVPAAQRKQQILALQALGLTQEEIATKLGCSRASIVRDLQDLRASKANLHTLLGELQTELAQLQAPPAIAQNYVELATAQKDASTRLKAQDKILELRGVITDHERAKIEKSAGERKPTPLFILPPGAHIAVDIDLPAADTAMADTTVRDITPRDTSATDTTISPTDTGYIECAACGAHLQPGERCSNTKAWHPPLPPT